MKCVSKGKKKYSWKRLFKGFGYAFCGIYTAIKTEFNLLIELVVSILIVIAGFLLQLSGIEFCIVIICIVVVVSLELINTSIENVVDMAMPEKHPLAKIAKDVAAGSVLFAGIGSVAIGLIIFLPKIVTLFS